MNDDASERGEANAEPSMEDILASIRKILADDKPANDQDEDDPNGLFGKSAAPNDDAEESSDSREGFIDDPDDVVIDEPEGNSLSSSDIDKEFITEGNAAGNWVHPDDLVLPQGTSSSSASSLEIFDLTPDMLVREKRKVLSEPTSDVATDVLSQLAKAILDRRDMSIGNRDVTLEGMVREMLRPLLREWLDRNLPYLIERLVKKEIDLMVNRAERLDD